MISLVKWCLFADDCILYKEIKAQDDSRILQNNLQTLEEWERKWKISLINVSSYNGLNSSTYKSASCMAIDLFSEFSQVSWSYNWY